MKELDLSETHRSFPFARTDARTSTTYLRALIGNSPIAIIALDARHRCEMCNPAFEKLFQYTSKELFAADLDSLIAGPEMVGEAMNLSRRVLQGHKVHTVTQRRRRDGMMVDVEIHGVPLVVDGELAGVYGLYQDVTELNKAQTAFRAISDKMDVLQQEERRKAARDLHDSTAQELTALNCNLTRLNSLVSDDDEALKRLVQQTREIASQCAAKIRSASSLFHLQPRAAVTASRNRTAAQLTLREREIMGLLADGMTSKEVAGRLGISIRTVESHRINISRKLSFGSIADLVRYAIQNGIAAQS